MLIKMTEITPLHDEYFIIAWHVLENNFPTIEINCASFIGIEYQFNEVQSDSILCILIPEFPGNSLQKPIEILPPNILVVRCPGDKIGLGKIHTSKLPKFRQQHSPKEISYNVIDLYSNNSVRRFLQLHSDSASSFNNLFRKIYALSLISGLENIPTGRDASESYEKQVKRILDYFFDDCDAIGEAQRTASNKSFRFDICYYIDLFKNDFWEKIRAQTDSTHLIVECKNSKDGKELGKAISQVEKYFTASNAGACAIITIRDKSNLHKMRHYSKIIENKSVFLLILDDSDLKSLLLQHPHSPLVLKLNGTNQFHNRSSIGVLYKMMDDARLDH